MRRQQDGVQRAAQIVAEHAKEYDTTAVHLSREVVDRLGDCLIDGLVEPARVLHRVRPVRPSVVPRRSTFARKARYSDTSCRMVKPPLAQTLAKLRRPRTEGRPPAGTASAGARACRTDRARSPAQRGEQRLAPLPQRQCPQILVALHQQVERHVDDGLTARRSTWRRDRSCRRARGCRARTLCHQGPAARAWQMRERLQFRVPPSGVDTVAGLQMPKEPHACGRGFDRGSSP